MQFLSSAFSKEKIVAIQQRLQCNHLHRDCHCGGDHSHHHSHSHSHYHYHQPISSSLRVVVLDGVYNHASTIMFRNMKRRLPSNIMLRSHHAHCGSPSTYQFCFSLCSNRPKILPRRLQKIFLNSKALFVRTW